MDHFAIYKVTNMVNGRFYIGKHQTKDLDDGYMGSGKLIQRAIKKYGIENFKKEILFVFATEAEMNAKEAELVTEELIASGSVYNLCPGGQGGWGYLNSSGRSNIGWKTNGTYRAKEAARLGGINAGRNIRENEELRKRKADNILKYRKDWLGLKHSNGFEPLTCRVGDGGSVL